MFKVYGKPKCVYCVQAMNLLEANHRAVEYVDVSQDKEALDFLVDQGFRSVPQIYYGDTHIGGFVELVKYLEEPA